VHYRSHPYCTCVFLRHTNFYFIFSLTDATPYIPYNELRPPSEAYLSNSNSRDECDSVDYDTKPVMESPNHSDASDSEPEPPPPQKVKRPPGRPPGAKAKAKTEKKTGRLWEFIRNLLHNPETCPSVICWEDHDEGIFRFVKSEKVAKIWGNRKNNDKMNYEKLSRAMRYVLFSITYH